MFILPETTFLIRKFSLSGMYLFSLLFFISSCKKDELIPSYIHIDKIELNSDYVTDGSNSNKITDAWVYLDDDLIGIYELPATFPVLATGDHKISVRAGIKINGIAKSRGYYPFYQSYTSIVNLQKERIDTLSPVVSYYPDKIKWKEDFEEAGITLVKFGESDTAFIKTTDPNEAFEGSYSVVAYLKDTTKYVLCVSDEKFDIPQTQTPVFLELNYKTSTYLNIGFYGKLPSGLTEKIPTLILNPTESWNKIYINLTLSANYSVNTTDFRVFFEASKPDDAIESKVYLDNIKLLY